MIFDQQNNLKRYPSLEAIRQFDPAKFQQGKFDIDENGLFAIGLEYETKDVNECLWEAHQKFLDVHLILEGEERVHITDISSMTESKAYDPEHDYALFTGEAQQELVLRKKDFLVLFPNEVHRTSVRVTSPAAVKKIVFKLPV